MHSFLEILNFAIDEPNIAESDRVIGILDQSHHEIVNTFLVPTHILEAASPVVVEHSIVPVKLYCLPEHRECLLIVFQLVVDHP